MSDTNMEIVRRVMESVRSGSSEVTTDVALALCDPEVEFTSRLSSVEGSSYKGHDGVRRYFQDMGDAWQEWSTDVLAVEELSPSAVLAESVTRAVGKSGVPVELRNAVVLLLLDGKITEIHSHESREEALEAAGLAE